MSAQTVSDRPAVAVGSPPSGARPAGLGVARRVAALAVVAVLGVSAAVGIVALARAARAPGSSGAPVAQRDSGELRVSRDFGAATLRDRRLRIPASATVMDVLAANAGVGTAYGGGFVNSIDGLASGFAPGTGTRADWFYFVNGIQADRGAADYELHSGDRVWWDYHRWGFAPSVPAVVGQFPQPFASRAPGALPTVVEYAGGFAAAGQEVAADLSAGGATRVSAVRLDPRSAVTGARHTVLVGTWAQLTAIPALAEDAAHPASSGLFASIGSGRLVTRDAAGGRCAWDAPAGLVLATASAEHRDCAIWLVTGAEPADVRAAARLLDGGGPRLQGSFGVAALRSGSTIALPTRPQR